MLLLYALSFPYCVAAQSLCSVKKNYITGDAAEKLTKVMPSMTDFGGIPIKALRDNTVIDLDLSGKDLGVPECMVLSGLLPSASSLAMLKCAASLPTLARLTLSHYVTLCPKYGKANQLPLIWIACL